MSAGDFHVGQTVLHVYGNQTPREVVVTKVGRTRVTVDHGYMEAQYHMDTGYAVKDFGGRIVTPERHADEQRRAAVVERLREEYGLSWAISRKISTDAAERVLAVLDEELGR